MRTLIIFVGFWLFWSGSYGAATNCQLDGGILKTRSKSVYLNFVDHRSMKELEWLNILVTSPEQITPENIALIKKELSRLNGFMDLDGQRRDVDRLQAAINQGQISWIGIEFSPEELAMRDDKGKSSADYFHRLDVSLGAAGVDPTTREQLLLLYAGSPARYVWFRDQGVQRLVELVPLDSNELKRKAIKFLDDSDFDLNLIKAFAKTRPSVLPDTNRVADKMRDLDRNWTELSDNEIAAFAATITDTDLSSYAITMFKRQREFFRNQRARDDSTTAVILNHSGNGWISEGRGHRRLIEGLLDRCEHQAPEYSAPAGTAQ